MTRSDVGRGHPQYYQDLAERIAARNARRLLHQSVQQPRQSAGPRNHDRPRDLGADRGTTRCRGVRRGLGRHADGAEPVLCRAWPRRSKWCWPIRPARCWPSSLPRGTIGEAGSWVVEGIGEDFIPPIADLSRVRQAFTITRRRKPDHGPRAAAARRHSGRLVVGHAGGRGPALLPRSRHDRRRVVTFVCDSGNKYLSKMFNDYWMADQGFRRPAACGDLRDVVVRPLRRGRRRQRGARRAAGDRLSADAAVRHLAIAGARRRNDRRHSRRIGPVAGGQSPMPAAFRRAGGETT